MKAGRTAFEQGKRDKAGNCFLSALNGVQQLASIDPDTGIASSVADAFGRLAEVHGGDGAYGLMARAVEDARSTERTLGRDHQRPQKETERHEAPLSPGINDLTSRYLLLR